MARRIVMLGAPASGKGTQAALLASRLVLPNLSTGALIRAEQQSGSQLGRLADEHLAGGGFLPDKLIVEIMICWLEKNGASGFVLDGFPRTLPQASAFEATLAEQGAELDAAILLEVDLETLHERIARRLECHSCGGTPCDPSADNESGSRCPEPQCRGTLQPRADDEPETYAGRLSNYRKLTEPVIHHYAAREVLKRVDGRASSAEVFGDILDQLGIRTTTKTI